jgi:hypothetical protein
MTTTFAPRIYPTKLILSSKNFQPHQATSAYKTTKPHPPEIGRLGLWISRPMTGRKTEADGFHERWNG